MGGSVARPAQVATRFASVILVAAQFSFVIHVCRNLAQRAKDLADQPSVLVNTADFGPMEAAKRLKVLFDRDQSKKQNFVETALANAVMGNCPKSRDSFRTGINISELASCYVCMYCLST